MAFTRKNVWAQGGDFNDPAILWYARGVAAMQARALDDRTAWRFFGAIHGFDQDRWQQVGALSESDPTPSQSDIDTFWAQCQHGSWYFLPWHRGYLIALEAVIRDAISTIPGAPSDWALPYWNYFNINQNGLPPAFASPDWPDGQGNNPLFAQLRFGPDGSGKVFVPMDQVDQNALGDARFIGPGRGGSQGFGGVKTRFSHSGRTHGGVESQPHDMVHVLVGGEDSSGTAGLMTDPDTAGLDPIFYLHHANIDRLWEVWKGMPNAQGDPDNVPDWAKGPANTGGQPFVMPMPGGQSMTFTPGQMSNLSTLNYVYDDTSPPSATPQGIARLHQLGVSPAAVAALARSPAMADPNVELLGANSQSIRLVGSEARTSLALDSAVKNKVASSLAAVRAAPAAAAQRPPDRVFLNLENVRGLSDATAFSVYINVPEGDDPLRHPELKAGSIGLFGVRKATARDGQHAGDGLTYTLEISHIVDALHLSGALDAGQIHVRLVPLRPVRESAQISIGRISVYREGT